MDYLTWWLRLPTSSSHALIGGQKAALFIVISPVAGLLVAAGLM